MLKEEQKFSLNSNRKLNEIKYKNENDKYYFNNVPNVSSSNSLEIYIYFICFYTLNQLNNQVLLNLFLI